MTLDTLLNDIRNRSFKPVYFLYGNEPFFIDQISDLIANTVLSDAEKGFNQMVLYGKDTSIDDIVSNAKRFPMMADYQVIIVKEAQHLSRTIAQLEPYLDQVQSTSILVFNYKYKSADKRKNVFKKIAKTGVLFESKPLYENQVPTWISQFVKTKGYSIDPKASLMLVEFLGTELSKIVNELSKLFILLPKGTKISPEAIEENIGISKDFNNFELRKAIGNKNIVKANQIIMYFSQNPKNNPTVMTISLLHSFFTQLLQYHAFPNKSNTKALAGALRVNPFFINDYITAGKNYPMRKVSQTIGFSCPKVKQVNRINRNVNLIVRFSG